MAEPAPRSRSLSLVSNLPPRTGTPADLLVVGLGNPGPGYEGTRHNLGAEVVMLLAARHSTPLRKGKERALVGEARVDGKLMALAFPQTFVNLSGESVGRLVRRFGIEDDLGRLIVVHDELDLPPGRIKIKEGGGIAGHNGLESIRAHLKSTSFVRVRIGIDKPPPSMSGADYVLKRPSKAEQVALDVAVEEGSAAVEMILAGGVASAMNRFNWS